MEAAPAYLGWTLLGYLRERLDLTGAKQSCDDGGTCGSCVVILDGGTERACRLAVRISAEWLREWVREQVADVERMRE